MQELLSGEVTCQVHLAATVRGLIRPGDGGAFLKIVEIQRNINPVRYYCTCRLPAEFHIDNVGMDGADDPFPIFRKVE